jgi:N-hydroxyarylamine O-acetyltransferase
MEHFGFKVRPLLARVHLESQPSGRTHLLNLVSFEQGPWIIDAGFGAGGLRRPLPLKTNIVKDDQGFSFGLEQRPPWGWMMRTLDKEEWKDSYSFDLEHVSPQDIVLGNFYTSHSPDTHFTQIRTASKPTSNGRISLRNFTFTEIADGKVFTEEIVDGPEYLDILATRFGIELEVDYNVLKKV